MNGSRKWSVRKRSLYGGMRIFLAVSLAAFLVVFGSGAAMAGLHSFEKSEIVPVEPNVLFFLDSSGSMLWPMNAPADERGSELCTFGDGTLGWKQNHVYLQEYWGRDVDGSNNDMSNPDNYHPKLLWKKGGDVQKDDTDSAMPNDSRAYKAKLVLWRIFNDKGLISGTRIGFATYVQTFVGADYDYTGWLADWYRYPVSGSYPVIPLNPDKSPQNYNNSWRLASGVVITENLKSKRAMLRSDFRSYIDENGLLKEQLLGDKVLKWIDGTEAYSPNSQCTPANYQLGNPEIRFDGWRPMAESLSRADKTANLTGTAYEGKREGDVADFFTMTDPRTITDYCQGNWLILLTSGGQSYGTETDLVNSVKALYNTTVRIGNQNSKNIRTIVLGFVDPASTNETVVALRNKLNRMADAGDDGVENSSATAFFATDVPGILSALRQILYYIKTQSSTSNAPLATPSRSAAGDDYYYQAQYHPQQGKQWKGDLVKYTYDGESFTKSWSAADILVSRDWGDRDVYTAAPGLTGELNNLAALDPSNTTKTSAMGSLAGLTSTEATGFFRWLLGKDEYDENKNGSTADEHHKLFDIYHSGIVKVGPPDASVNDVDYRDFLTTYKDRPVVLYTQSNGGMLHAFNDTDGTERFAFIPPNILTTGRLRGMKWDDIAKRFDASHTFPRYLADGPIIAEDVYVDGGYRTLLMGLLGLGGAGMYAMDVTNPASPSFRWAVENAIFQDYDEKLLTQNNAKVILWNKSGNSVSKSEYVHKDIKTANENIDYRELRFTVSTPFIGYIPITASGQTTNTWSFIVGNGSSRGIVGEGQIVGVAHIGRVSDGTLIRNLSSSAAQRFVSPVAVLNEGVRRKIRLFYIGDMGGVIFKGDLSDPNPANWTDLTQVFQITAGVGISYSLDAALISGKIWLFAGTGDIEGYLGTQSSNNYFIAANLTNGASNQNQLTALDPTDFAEISSNTKGWAMQFTNGERMSTPPLIYKGYVFFSTFIPDADPCSPGGTSRLYVLKADTGAGGWDPETEGGVNPKYIELSNIAVGGISVAADTISVGVTLFGTDEVGDPFTLLGDNLLVTEVPAAVNSGISFPTGSMQPFYWKSR